MILINNIVNKLFDKLELNKTICYVVDTGDYLGGATIHLIRHSILARDVGFKVLVCIPSKHKYKEEIVEKTCKDNELEYCFINYATSYEFSMLDLNNIENSVDEFVNLAKDKCIGLFHSVQLNPAVEMSTRILKVPHVMSIYQIDKDSFDLGFPNLWTKFIHSDSLLYSKIWAKGLNASTVCIKSWIPEKFFRECDLEKVSNRKLNFNMCISGTVCLRKSQLKVIEAINRIRNNGISIRLNIIGYADKTSGYVNECKEYIKINNLENLICIKGFSNNIISELRECDALICSSIEESFPQAILEAMAIKLPVISTPVAGVPELIKDNETGYLTVGFQSDNIEKTILRFVSDFNEKPTKLKKVINNAYKLVCDECSRENVSEKLFSFYYKAIIERKDYTESEKNVKLLLNDYFLSSQEVKINIIDELDEYQKKIFSQFEVGVFYKMKYLSRVYENKEVNYYIWGASNAGIVTKIIINNYLSNFKFMGYIDKYKSGENIFKPEELSKKNIEYIFIATAPGKENALNYAQVNGLKQNYNFMSLFF